MARLWAARVVVLEDGGVTAVWADAGDRWTLLAPTGFADEKTPDLLPLAGSPRLAVIGRGVWLGGNKADLVAIESSGRLCIIEVKLAANSESRRAVVAQVLSCAGYLYGMSVGQVESEVLAGPLHRNGFTSLADAAEQAGQDGSFDRPGFDATLADTLETGGFRLVLVLDAAPPELVRTVGFLQSVAPAVVIDLVTVTAYEVGDRRVLVPQRVEPSPRADRPGPATSARSSTGTATPGSEAFRRSIADAPADQQQGLCRLAEWAEDLQQRGLVTLTSYQVPAARSPYFPGCNRTTRVW